MPVPFQCGKCSFKANLKDELLGKKIKCPKCAAVGQVGVAAAAGAALNSGKKARKAPPDDEENPFANLGDPSKFGSEIDPEDEDYELLMEEIAPKKKKKVETKKKVKAPADEGVNTSALAIVAVFVLGGLGAIGAGGYYVLPSLMGTAVVEPPQQFKKHHHLHGGFYLQVPEDAGWIVTESENKPGVPDWLKVANGGVIMRVDEDEGGSLIGRTTAMGGNAAEMSQIFAGAGVAEATVNPSDPDISRTLHDRARAKFESYSQYEEGNVTPIDGEMGQGRWCEITYAEGFGKKKGYRATFFDGNTCWVILCTCPEANFDAMKPTFEKVIKSLEGIELIF